MLRVMSGYVFVVIYMHCCTLETAIRLTTDPAVTPEVDDVEVVFQHGLKRLYFFWPLGVIQAAMDLGRFDANVT